MTLEILERAMTDAMKQNNRFRKNVIAGMVDVCRKAAITPKGRIEITEELVNETLLKYSKMIKEMITSSNYDMKKRIMEILAETKSQKQMQLMGAGHVASINRALSYIRKSSYYNELVDGISQYSFIEIPCSPK